MGLNKIYFLWSTELGFLNILIKTLYPFQSWIHGRNIHEGDKDAAMLAFSTVFIFLSLDRK